MNTRRILVGTIVVGIVANALDYLLNTYYWKDAWAAFAWVNPTPPLMWLVIGDFAAALMFMLAWDRYGASSGGGAGGGFRFGLFAGAFVNFPMVLFFQMYVKDFPYGMAWQMIIIGVLFYGVMGAVAGVLDRKMG